MKKLELYTGTKTYMYPNGDIAYPQRIEQDFPAVRIFQHVIETDEAGQVCFAVVNLATLESQNNIDLSLSDEEAIAALEEILNAPEPEQEPTAEERIAAAMEFQNMVTLMDL